jgi:hypothetical protein
MPVLSKDPRKNKKVSMNRQGIPSSPFFALRKNKVAWPTIRKAYMNDENVEVLKKYVTSKGRSIVFLDGEYITKLNRYVGKAPEERAVFFEFMCKDKDIKGGIFLLCWIGNFHNGCIFHAAPQFPQAQCWYDALGKEEADRFFERHAIRIYREVVNIVHQGQPIQDDEVREFVQNSALRDLPVPLKKSSKKVVMFP